MIVSIATVQDSCWEQRATWRLFQFYAPSAGCGVYPATWAIRAIATFCQQLPEWSRSPISTCTSGVRRAASWEDISDCSSVISSTILDLIVRFVRPRGHVTTLHSGMWLLWV